MNDNNTSKDEAIAEEDTDKYVWTVFNGTHIRLDTINQICFFHSENSITKVHADNGRSYPLKLPLLHYRNLYHGGQYFLIDRSTLINSNFIKGFKKGLNRTLILVLELPFEIKELDADFITVSRDKVKGFKNWFLK